MLEPQSHGVDLVLGMPVRWGMTFGLVGSDRAGRHLAAAHEALR